MTGSGCHATDDSVDSVSTSDAASERMTTGMPIDLGIAIVGLAVFGYIAATNDVIEVGGGLGFDGANYAQMMSGSLAEGTAATRLRPLIVLLNRPVYWLTKSPLFAFGLMNHVYAAALWYQVCALYRRFDPRPIGRLLIVVNLSLCIATSKMFTYYPVLVDLGAYAVITWAMVRVLRGPGWVTALAVAAAMLSREFGICVALFAVHRYVRLRLPFRHVVLTVAPAVVAFAAVWLWNNSFPREQAGSMFALENIARNATLWNDAVFVAFFLYFAVTVFGGIGVVLATSGDKVLHAVAAEPEWFTFSAPVLLAAAFGSADLSRYFAYLLPAAVVMYARCSAEWSLPRLLVVSALVIVLTLVLQDPFRHMTLPEYFRRWFPYYVEAGKIPVSQRLPLAPVWIRLVVALGIGLLVMPALARSVTQTEQAPVGRPG